MANSSSKASATAKEKANANAAFNRAMPAKAKGMPPIPRYAKGTAKKGKK